VPRDDALGEGGRRTSVFMASTRPGSAGGFASVLGPSESDAAGLAAIGELPDDSAAFASEGSAGM
jgi:hypothetical protein